MIYRFSVVDGKAPIEPVEAELPDTEAARAEAATLAGTLLKDEPARFWDTERWAVQVSTREGALLFSIVIAGVDAPSTARVQAAA